MRKVNYLNNKDILKEIHKSKSTFCSFIDPSYKDYDMIILNVDKINKNGTPLTNPSASRIRSGRWK